MHGPLECEDKLSHGIQMAMLEHLEDMKMKRNMDFMEGTDPMEIRWVLPIET